MSIENRTRDYVLTNRRSPTELLRFSPINLTLTGLVCMVGRGHTGLSISLHGVHPVEIRHLSFLPIPALKLQV